MGFLGLIEENCPSFFLDELIHVIYDAVVQRHFDRSIFARVAPQAELLINK